MHLFPASRGRSGVAVSRRRAASAAVAAVAGALAVVPAAAGAAAAPSFYVDGSSVGGKCSDARTPAQVTPSTPWCSLQTGITKAPDGGVVFVRRGTYGRVALSDMRRADYVNVAPYPGEAPRVTGMSLSGVHHLRVVGITFTSGIVAASSSSLQFINNDFPFVARGVKTPSSFVFSKVKQALIQGNHVANGKDGVNLQGDAPGNSDIVIWSNHFERLGGDAVHVGSYSARVLVAANFLDNVRRRADIDKDLHADGMQVWGPTEDFIAWGNYVVGGRGILFGVSPRNGARPFGNRGAIVENNVFLGPDFAVRALSAPGLQLINNTVWGTSSSEHTGIDILDRAGSANDRTTGVVLANNVVKRLFVTPGSVRTRTGNVVQQANGTVPGETVATPEFTAPQRGDFRLQPGTVGHDVADRSWAPVVDIEGRLRQARPDAGAFEAEGSKVTGVFMTLPDMVATILETAGLEEDTDPETYSRED